MSTARELPVTGTFTVQDQVSAPFKPSSTTGFPAPFNMAVWGTFSGNVITERSFDRGVTWIQAKDKGTSVHSFGVPGVESDQECESDVWWRFKCATYNSGTIFYRLSQ